MKNVLVVGSASVTGLNVVRSFAKSDANVTGCDITSLNPSRELCENFIVPRAHDTGYVGAMRSLVEERNITHAVVCDDHDLRVLYENRDVVFPNVTVNGFAANTDTFLDKVATTELFCSLNITTPKRVDTIVEVNHYPVMIRNRYSGSYVGAKFKIVLRDYDEWLRSGYMHAHSNSNLRGDHWTRFIEGQEYTVDVLCTSEGEPLSIVPRIRHVVRDGMVHHSEIVNDQEIIEQTSSLVKTCGLVGMNCVQCIKDVTGIVHFIEINSRPGSGLDLTINAGVDMPALWLENATIAGEPTWGMQMVRCHTGCYFVP